MIAKLCIDWDGTLVDTGSQEWLPGAQEALRALLKRGYKITIHSSRANWEGGMEQIRLVLGKRLADQVELAGKPVADLYIDNLALTFAGDWTPILAQLRHASRR